MSALTGKVKDEGRPIECQACGADANKLKRTISFGSWVCRDCGVISPFVEERGLKITRTPCIYCCSVEGGTFYEGTEYCDGCGIPVGVGAASSPAIAHLYKGKVRDLLLAGKHQSGTPVGDFIRSSCGPHCKLSVGCEQDSPTFFRCYRDGVTASFHASNSSAHPIPIIARIPAKPKERAELLTFVACSNWDILPRKKHASTHANDSATDPADKPTQGD